MLIPKIGFACKLSQFHPDKGVISIPEYTTQTTTRAWMNRQTRSVAEQRLGDIIKHNIEATFKLVEKVGTWNESLRMVRLSSDILPLRTESSWKYFYLQSEILEYVEKHFAKIGKIAREKNVRLSFHPGQFCCIVSESDGIVQNSLEELEYHADMMRWMGYGNSLLDAKINVHLSGKRGIDGFDAAWNRMSPELRNMLTLENDEFQSGLDTVLKLKDRVGIVLDLHHHWIATGEYIEASDKRIAMVIESWTRDGRDRRPTIHYSVSREDYLVEHARHELPNVNALIESGHKKAKLRAHSDFMWSDAVNNWAKTHWEWADLMIECKSKNLGAHQLFEFWKQSEKVAA